MGLYGFEGRECDKRRVPDVRDRSWNIKQLWQRSHEIINLALSGNKNSDIARKLGITAQTVSNTLNSPMAQEKLSAMRLQRDCATLDVAKEVSRLLPKAMKIYEEILDGKGDRGIGEKASPHLVKMTADTIMQDLGGYRQPAKIQGMFAHAHLTKDEIDELKERGRSAMHSAGMIVDGEAKSERI